MIARVLTIAGSDSGGGAGIQADLKTLTALGAYGLSALTALTVQDTLGVHAVLPVPPDFVAHQVRCALADPGADVVKLGMLGGAEVAAAVAAELARHPALPVVLDPVMIAKGGAPLLEASAVAVLRDRLLPRAAVLTPNLPEAAALCGFPVETLAERERCCAALLALGAGAVLLKGGHGTGETVVDLLATADGVEAFAAPRLPGRHTHGTGCTLASAVAAGLAQGMTLRDAVLRARRYVRAAIAAAPGLGAGHGPLAHWVTVDSGAAGRRVRVGLPGGRAGKRFFFEKKKQKTFVSLARSAGRVPSEN